MDAIGGADEVDMVNRRWWPSAPGRVKGKGKEGRGRGPEGRARRRRVVKLRVVAVPNEDEQRYARVSSEFVANDLVKFGTVRGPKTSQGRKSILIRRSGERVGNVSGDMLDLRL